MSKVTILSKPNRIVIASKGVQGPPGTAFPDAPDDGGAYIRVNGAWVQLYAPLALAGDLPDGTVDEPYTATLTASGGRPPYTLGDILLPPGLDATLADTTVTVAGTPTEEWEGEAHIDVSDSLGTAIRSVFDVGMGGGAKPIYPLDLVTGDTPQFAYSTRKLTAAYSGPAIRVVRPIDSAEADIGFSADGKLDAAALDAFLGAQVGRVLTRYDQSGRGNHSTQPTASLRGQISTIEIGGVRVVQLLSSTYPIPAAVSVQKRNVHWFAVQEFLESGRKNGMIQMGAGGAQNSIFQQSVAQIQCNGGGVNGTAPNQTRAVLYEYAASAAGVYLQTGFHSNVGGAVADAAMVGGLLGGTTLSGGYEGKSYTVADIMFSRRLGTDETAVLRSALRESFSMAPTPPTAHVVFNGDSIVVASVGAAGNYGFAKQAQRMLPNTVATYNVAGGGNQLNTNILGNYAANAGLIFDALPGTNRIGFIMAGTNDLTIGGRTAAQIYADVQTYAGLVRADGAKIIVSTILPNKDWDSTQQATRNDLNALIRANWASFADGFADFADDATMGPQAAAANASLYPDGLHPSVLGHSHLAPIAAAAINALL